MSHLESDGPTYSNWIITGAFRGVFSGLLSSYGFAIRCVMY